MKRKSYIDRILNFLNNDYNKETIFSFDLFSDIENE